MQHIESIKKLFNKNFVESPLIESFDVGLLHLSSGRVVACDPIITNDKEPFEAEFPRGDFPIHIHKERDSDCVAYVEVVFSDKEISYWQMATCKGQKVEELAEGEVFGYPVQSGMGCIMDADTQEMLNALEQKLYNQKGDAFMGIYEEFFHSYFTDEKGIFSQYALPIPKENAPNNLIATETGYGEGFYASYIAFDKENSPVKLITEFIEVG